MHSQPLNRHSHPFTVHRQPLNRQSHLLTVHRQPLNQHRHPFTMHSQPLSRHSQPFIVHRQPLNRHSHLLTVHRQPLNLYRRPFTVNSQPLRQLAMTSIQRRFGTIVYQSDDTIIQSNGTAVRHLAQFFIAAVVAYLGPCSPERTITMAVPDRSSKLKK